MRWADVVTPPSTRTLRQFAGIALVVFGGLAALRMRSGQVDAIFWVMSAAAVGVGGIGLIAPRAVRGVYLAWMVAAFPIGWTVSHLVLALLFFLVFTPIAAVFRLIGRDPLRLRRPAGSSFWTPRTQVDDMRRYFRQF